MKFRMESFDEILLEAMMETMRFPSTMVMKKNTQMGKKHHRTLVEPIQE